MTAPGRLAAVVEYDGTDFLGYQIQARGRTVQGEIEKTIKKVTQTEVRIAGAGRTDAGVHARGQVVAFDVSWRHGLPDLHRAINAELPGDVVFSELRLVDKAFHPRFSALSRSYRYTIVAQPWRPVLQNRYAYHLPKKLNVPAMNDASQTLIGSHDFSSFGKPPEGTVTIRNVIEARWTVTDCNLTFDITANAFLYRMVRRIVATLIKVGSGQLTVREFEEILEAKNLICSAPPAPARGLCLERVTYPPESWSQESSFDRGISDEKDNR
ncbi:MAG: tRNA pseudouridine(38-40) synthase TruA [Anaerolineae bacterium]|nr:tRNA pseudouridine(38-40) synthase TruA [Anaerolineae bacterium]